MNAITKLNELGFNIELLEHAVNEGEAYETIAIGVSKVTKSWDEVKVMIEATRGCGVCGGEG